MVGARTYRWLSKFRAAASPDPRVRVCVCVNTCEYLHADALASRDWLLSYRLYVRAEAVIAAVSRVYVHFSLMCAYKNVKLLRVLDLSFPSNHLWVS